VDAELHRERSLLPAPSSWFGNEQHLTVAGRHHAFDILVPLQKVHG
jgi:hypothetical protein